LDARPQPIQRDTRPFLGLRWKVLIGISLTLAAVIVSLTFYARAMLIGQFERDQAQLRLRQAQHFNTLLADRYQQMARLASVVPRLASESDDTTVVEHLRNALQADGSLLDLEWDIRSLHWIPMQGESIALWPPQEDPALPPALLQQVRDQPEQISQRLLCNPDACRQYLASPVLWDGETAGSLVLGRSIASILLTFRELTDANLAIATLAASEAEEANPPVELQLLGVTQPEQMLPLLESVPIEALLATHAGRPVTLEGGDDWYEAFWIDPDATGLLAFVINRTTDDRRAIEQTSRNSLIIGSLGLLVAELLLLLSMQGPVNRIRDLARLLPLLAEHRFDALAARLPRSRSRVGVRDEIDETIAIADTLNQRMAWMQTERDAVQDELRWLAEHDPLTTLLNRHRFDRELGQAIEQAQQRQARGALLFIDLDNFKDVNDTSGHQIGDRLLKRVGKRLAGSLDANAKVGRFGGDEFAVLIDDAEPEQTMRLAERLQELIRATSVRAGTHRHQVTASIGVVLFPDHGTDTQALMANADLAMYQAKARERQRCYLYSHADSARAQANARVLWKREISEALKADRFRLHYQPIMHLPEGRIWRAEGLLRLYRPDGRLAAPGEFIPIAERTALINAIDRWVLAEAIRVLAEQRSLSLAINLSAKALTDTGLEATLGRLLDASGIDPQRLTLEITETVAIDNISTAAARMQSIRGLGCRFALDDFGSGFASYAYLKQLPVEDVKIDGSFIRDLDRNIEDRIFVKAAVEMAHAMGKKVVAEFVDSKAILEVLGELGVDFAQGYFIGRPAPEPPAPEPAVAAGSELHRHS
jgi:diguanylate cyclase (GGDEF)-like protein